MLRDYDLMIDSFAMVLVVDHGLHVYVASIFYIHALDRMVHML